MSVQKLAAKKIDAKTFISQKIDAKTFISGRKLIKATTLS